METDKKKKTITILKVIAIIMLLWALADNDYFYYQLLRWVITGVAGYSAYSSYTKGENNWTWIFAIIAILFNPITPFYLDREVWMLIDIIAAIIIFISIFKLKEVVPKGMGWVFTIIGIYTVLSLSTNSTCLAIVAIIATLYHMSSLANMKREVAGLEPENPLNTTVNFLSCAVIIVLLIYSFSF